MGKNFNIQENILLAGHSTIGLGGKAKYFATCGDVSELIRLLEWSRGEGHKVFILGGGSNVLFSDKGFDGLVIKIGFGDLTRRAEGEWAFWDAGAGVCWDDFVTRAVDQGDVGIECLAGIPGTVGATPIQNVGAYGQEVADVIEDVEALDIHSHKLENFRGEECNFAYRQSRFKGKDFGKFIITKVTYRLNTMAQPQPKYRELIHSLEEEFSDFESFPRSQKIRYTRDHVLRLRSRKSMVLDASDPNSKSLGSFFMNPILSDKNFETFLSKCNARGIDGNIPQFQVDGGVKLSAAWLAEQSGYPKGFKENGAGLSENHALALVNRGGNTEAVKALAAKIQGSVRDTFAVDLHPEPLFVGP